MQTNSTRVLGRTGARELTPEEIENIVGGIHTNTACTFEPITQQADGDRGEC